MWGRQWWRQKDWFILGGALLSIFAVCILSLPKSDYKLLGWSTQTEIFTQVSRRWDSAEHLRAQETRAGNNFFVCTHTWKVPNQAKPIKQTKHNWEIDSLVKRSQRFRLSSNGPSRSDQLCPENFQRFGQTSNQFLSPHCSFQPLLFPAGLTCVLST